MGVSIGPSSSEIPALGVPPVALECRKNLLIGESIDSLEQPDTRRQSSMGIILYSHGASCIAARRYAQDALDIPLPLEHLELDEPLDIPLPLEPLDILDSR